MATTVYMVAISQPAGLESKGLWDGLTLAMAIQKRDVGWASFGHAHSKRDAG